MCEVRHNPHSGNLSLIYRLSDVDVKCVISDKKYQMIHKMTESGHNPTVGYSCRFRNVFPTCNMSRRGRPRFGPAIGMLWAAARAASVCPPNVGGSVADQATIARWRLVIWIAAIGRSLPARRAAPPKPLFRDDEIVDAEGGSGVRSVRSAGRSVSRRRRVGNQRLACRQGSRAAPARQSANDGMPTSQPASDSAHRPYGELISREP